MTNLLNKPLRSFSIFALLILLCSIPVYYLVIDSIWINELDEHNESIKDQVVDNFSNTDLNHRELTNILDLWNLLQPETKLIEVSDSIVMADSVYTVEEVNLLEDEDKERFRVLCSYLEINNKNYQLTIKTNVEEADETILIIGLVTLFFFILMVVGFILLNKRIASKVWLPFQKTLTKLKEFNLSDEKGIHFDNTDISEFAELNKELTRLIQKNIEVYQLQKKFVENASHELQTPLAILKTKLDLLLQSEDLTASQSELLNSIAIPLARLTRLNKNLLILAKIENQQFSEKESISLDTALKENIHMLEDYILSKGVKIDISEVEKCTLMANRFLVETLLNNLITNSIKHCNIADTIYVTLKSNELIISNPGQSSLDHELLFKRFSTGSSESGNSGLGLAIIREICILNGWLISYSFIDGQHQFSVKF